MSRPAIQHSIAAAQHAAATAPLAGTHAFWITLLLGLLIALIAPSWVAWILVVVALGRWEFSAASRTPAAAAVPASWSG